VKYGKRRQRDSTSEERKEREATEKWKVKLSSTALLSSQESEYAAGSDATKEAGSSQSPHSP
jgi:hypothetical protein